VALSTASVGDLVVVFPGSLRPAVASVESPTLVDPMSEAREVSTPVMPGADGASPGAAIVEVDGDGPRLGDNDRGLLRDLVR
jgi:hypothetical protein